MDAVRDTLAASPARAEILADLLELGRARPGLTLIAAFHADTLRLAGFVRLNTPRPPDGEGAQAIVAARMSPTLAQIARLFVPSLPEGAPPGVGTQTHTLVTVVCREGEVRPTPSEEQFVQGWHACADGTSAHHGGVYSVTPAGWMCLQGGSGDEPRLVLDADSYAFDDDVIEFPPLVDPDELARDAGVLAAEQVLAEVFAEDFPVLAAPGRDECLACYVTRMIGRFGCDESWRFVDHYSSRSDPSHADASTPDWRREGQCDCDVYDLGYDLADDVEEPVEHLQAGDMPVVLHHEWPWPNPHPCRGIESGSIEPCSLWQSLQHQDW